MTPEYSALRNGGSAETPVYLLFDHLAETVTEEGVAIRELDEIDALRQVVEECSDEETPLFFTCT